MEIKENEKIKKQKHDHYEDFELQQYTFIYENPVEKIVIQVLDSTGKEIFKKEFQPKFINTHLDITWQDKGTKSEESLYKMVRVRK